MRDVFLEEYNKLVVKLEELKGNISKNYSTFVGFNAPICELTDDMIKREQEKIEMYISDIDKTISKLNISQKKVKSIDKSNKILEEIKECTQARDSYYTAQKINELNLLPETEPFRKNYKAIESLLYAIKYVVHAVDFGTADKYKTYNNALKDITGSEERFPEVVDLILNDYYGTERINLSKEIPKILESPVSTPNIRAKRPQKNN